MKKELYIWDMNNTQTHNTMNLEQYNLLREDFSKKQEALTKWCESSTDARKEMKSYKTLKKEAQIALVRLEGWINRNA